MCVNYRPPPRPQLAASFGVEVFDLPSWPDEAWKDYAAPIIRLSAEGDHEATVGTYGIVPRRHIPDGVRPFDTMNARSETIGTKRSYAKAWRNGQTCLVPMTCFFEPRYDDAGSRSVRWRIGLCDLDAFAVAGLWRSWTEADGATSIAFTQLTVNADEHPFMRQFHKPGDEKRSLVIVRPEEYDAWLACRDPEMARSFLTLFPAERMIGRPEPVSPRRKVAVLPVTNSDLFG